MGKKLNIWLRVGYGALNVIAALTAIMQTGHADYPYALLLFGGALVVVSARRQWRYDNTWILAAGLVLIHVGAFANGLTAGLHLSHHLMRLLVSAVILALHLKVSKKW